MLDVNYGNGFFNWQFFQSGDFKTIIALDFPKNMLRQTYEWDNFLMPNILNRFLFTHLHVFFGSKTPKHDPLYFECLISSWEKMQVWNMSLK